jgi:hypothetical protein
MRKPGIATWIGLALVLAAGTARALSAQAPQTAGQAGASAEDVVPDRPLSPGAREILRAYRILAPIFGLEEARAHAVPEAPDAPRPRASRECSRANAPHSPDADECTRRPAHLHFDLLRTGR